MVALVTGGGRGIGQAIALRLARDGWSVAIAARSADQLMDTVALSSCAMIGIPADISQPDDVKQVTRRVAEELGPVDLLVNNAASPGPLGAFWETDPGEWWHCQEVNLRGPMLLCHELLPGMTSRRRGSIVNIVSGAGTQAFPGLSAYVASKTALVRFSEQLALEAKPFGVSVFAVAPGLVRTRMVEEARTRLPFIQQMLDDGMAVPADAPAALVATLASGRADALSGRFIYVGQDVDDLLRQAATRDDACLLRLVG
jgi:NAD(P)-dependent dehydrogenase (short-subunit alcohol dehydrogenase family)